MLNLDGLGESKHFYALYGMIELVSSKYLAIITKCKFVAQLLQKDLFKATKIEFIPVSNESNLKEDEYYLKMINKIFKTKTFYFSFDYDLTKNL